MIHLSLESHVALLRLDHGKANALDVALLRDLDRAIAELEADDACHAAVLTGTGRIFSAGVDLLQVLNGGDAYLDEFLPLFRATFARLFAFAKPAVAALNGHAIAGGCVMACACDYRIMAQGNGTIGVPELKVGVPFPGVAIEILRFAVPEHLTELVFLGRTYPVDEAQRLGVVHETVGPGALLERAATIAEQLGTTAPDRFRLTKRQLRTLSLVAIQRHEEESDAAIFAAWKHPATHAAIERYVEETLR